MVSPHPNCCGIHRYVSKGPKMPRSLPPKRTWFAPLFSALFGVFWRYIQHISKRKKLFNTPWNKGTSLTRWWKWSRGQIGSFPLLRSLGYEFVVYISSFDLSNPITRSLDTSDVRYLWRQDFWLNFHLYRNANRITLADYLEKCFSGPEKSEDNKHFDV